ncbi:MAG: dUTP diphosphatase [Ruminococcaceae bacterium]|nr:dUTP diphosphatase [Oscillospiraceae bacterium]
MRTRIEIKKLNEKAIIPTYGTEFSAGADIYALLDEPVTIAPGETVFIHTGIAIAIPEGLVGLNFARSGMAAKRGLAPANKVGVIDSDYRGEVMVALHNHGKEPQTVEHGDRVAQMVFVPYYAADFVEVDELDSTVRGEGGFGSTGTK